MSVISVFHLRNCASVMPYCFSMVTQESLDVIKWNFLQVEMVPGSVP